MNTGAEDENTYYTIGEVDIFLSSLSQPELTRSILLIKQQFPERVGLTADDLFSTIVEKLITGTRRWKKNDSFPTFIYSTAKSLINNESKKITRKPENVEFLEETTLPDSSATASNETFSEEDTTATIKHHVQELFEFFKSDKEISCILINILRKNPASKIKEICKLAERNYEAAMKRLKRQARSKFPGCIDYLRVTK